MSLNAQWMQRDLAVLWHPCTQMKDHERLPVIPIKRGDGVWLEDFDGKRYLDAVSSWWVNVFGHGNPRINQRIKDQLDNLEHVMLAGFSHQPVIELSERLVQITPAGLDRVFYAGKDAFAHKPGAAVASARRAGTTASVDVLDKYFTIAQMPVVSSTYWNMVYGRVPGEAEQDLEGMQTMQNLAKNMAWMMKCFELGRKNGIALPDTSAVVRTDFIR